MPTNSNGKDTVYIDIDDEITTIIEKVRASNEKIVALVLPKRATVLQSIVNMKLLKRTADNESKRVVLITSEAGLLPLAGATGMYVAKTLQTKPEVPSVSTPAEADEPAEEAELDDAEEITPETAGSRPIGELAGLGAVAAADEVETVELDDTPAATDAAAAEPAAKAKKVKKNKKLAVPNFEKFRMLLFAGIALLILLIVGGVFAATALPKAEVTITTDTSSVNSALTFTADTAAKSLSTTDNKLVLPAISQQTQKTQTQQVSTTGKKNNGQKATGSVVLTTCATSPGQLNPVAAGTGVVTNGHTYIMQQSASFNYAGSCNGSSFKFQSGAVDITAINGGADYNVSSASFTVAGRSDVSATGSASGGTDEILQVVAQADIDSANQKIAAQDNSALKQQLQNQLKQAGLFPLVATFVAGTPTTTTSSNVGDQASTVTVTQAITYTMFGVKESDLKKLVDNDIKDKIDTSKQSILNEGLDKASFHVNTANATSAQIAMTTTATAGPDLHADELKKQIAGKKAGQVQDMIKSDPGVTDVKVHLSPFWVTSVPSKASKVTITFVKAQ